MSDVDASHHMLSTAKRFGSSSVGSISHYSYRLYINSCSVYLFHRYIYHPSCTSSIGCHVPPSIGCHHFYYLISFDTVLASFYCKNALPINAFSPRSRDHNAIHPISAAVTVYATRDKNHGPSIVQRMKRKAIRARLRQN
jgi:hypothetical protein